MIAQADYSIHSWHSSDGPAAHPSPAQRIRRHRLIGDTLRAIDSLTNELAGMLLRLPLWEWKYRWHFRSPPSR